MCKSRTCALDAVLLSFLGLQAVLEPFLETFAADAGGYTRVHHSRMQNASVGVSRFCCFAYAVLPGSVLSFELLGADVLLDKEGQPWLLEDRAQFVRLLRLLCLGLPSPRVVPRCSKNTRLSRLSDLGTPGVKHLSDIRYASSSSSSSYILLQW